MKYNLNYKLEFIKISSETSRNLVKMYKCFTISTNLLEFYLLYLTRSILVKEYRHLQADIPPGQSKDVRFNFCTDKKKVLLKIIRASI